MLTSLLAIPLCILTRKTELKPEYHHALPLALQVKDEQHVLNNTHKRPDCKRKFVIGITMAFL